MDINVYIRKINYYETDKMGITHHSNYIRFMEEARISFLEQIGCGYEKWERDGIVSPVIGIECDYKRPTTFGDEIRIEVIENLMTKEQKKFMKAMKRFPSVLRTQYVLALLFEKDTAKAETIKGEFEKVAKTYPYSQDIESERDLMEIAERKLQKETE